MKQVEVIINLPVKNFNSLYSYAVPPEMEANLEPGVRVLVELGKKQVEGLVATSLEDNCRPGIKPIMSVLDAEPVVSPKQIELARWISDTYICPLPMAINLMISLLNRPLKKSIKAALTREDYNELPPQLKSAADLILLEILWQKGERPLEEIQALVDSELIHKLQKQEMVSITGKYGKTRPVCKDMYYRLNPQREIASMQQSLSRAPQQFKILNLLQEQGPIECSQLKQMVSPGSIAALLKKDYIIMERSPIPHIKRAFELNTEQQQVLKKINEKITRGQNAEMLLYGITGSGKTEVYIEAAQTVIDRGKGVLVLVPEIALTRHLVGVFSARFENMAVLHSGMSKGERLEQWQRIRNGEIELVLGTRSAVFAPLDHIGLIVVDEEQENTYKQEETPRYHAREVAAFRARQDDAVLLLGSATPSIETFHRATKGEIELLTLSERAGNAAVLTVKVADLKDVYKNGNTILSTDLLHNIEDNLGRGEQTILFLNRRGYTPVTTCMNCGSTLTCPHCSVALNYHRDINRNVCHYCNYQSPVPSECPACGSSHLRKTGIGTQKIEEAIINRFPQARVMRLDMDSSRKKGYQEHILKLMRDKEIDILIGTQMVTKGLDFPGVSLVGIVDADSILNLPDFRAAERCFQLIVQAAGRAGRGDIPGEVVIQTFNPYSTVIQMAARQDYLAFYQSEIKIREMLHYPPFTNLLRVVVSSAEESRAGDGCSEIVRYIKEITDASEEYLDILGPAPCPLAKIRNRYRYQLIIKSDNLLLITSIAKYIIYNDIPDRTRVEVEINPLTTI